MLLFPLMFIHPVNLEIRCGAPGLAGPRGPVLWGPARVRSDLNFSRPPSPAEAGKTAQTEGSVSPPRRRCPLAAPGKGGGGRELRPAVHRQGRAPTCLGLCAGNRWRLPPRRKLTLQPLRLPLPPPPGPERVAA